MDNRNFSSVPDENKMEELLAMIQPVPSDSFQQRMTQASWRVERGSQGAPIKRNVRIRLAAASTILLVAVTAIFARQGRVLAQDILQFFTRAESDTFYEEPSDLTVEETTPFLEECGSWIRPTCSMEQIRSMVDFEIKELGTVPERMYFGGATGGADLIGYAFLYDDPDRLGGQLSVIVEPISRAVPWTVAKSANVEQVRIGNKPGEYYTGVLFQDEQGNVTWQPDDPTATLRWEDGGSRYTMYYYSTRYPLSKEDFVRLAESMTLEPMHQ